MYTSFAIVYTISFAYIHLFPSLPLCLLYLQDGAAADLNEIGPFGFVKSLAETENEEDGMDIDMNYESDSENTLSTSQNLYRPSLPTNSQKGFERALEAVAAEPESDEEEEEEDVSVCVGIGMHFSFDMGIVSFANRSISFIYHSIRTIYVTERRGVEC